MHDYLCVVITNGTEEWQHQAIAVPRVGDSVTMRKELSGDKLMHGTVKEVHWEVRTSGPGMIVTVWIE